jgi:hypothetical protein
MVAAMSVIAALAAAAKVLGNSRTFGRTWCGPPGVVESYHSGHLIEGLRTKADLAEEAHDFNENERAVLNFLRHQAAGPGLNKKTA